MGLFSRSRRRTEPYGLWSDDAARWETFLGRGADASTARDLEVTVAFTAEDNARAAGKTLAAEGARGELVPPSHGVEEWGILIHWRDTALVPDVLKDAVDLGERIAHEHSGEYGGWTAFYTKQEKAAWGVELLDGL
ncbi:ribonuclease E inhibitor RraB [Demequina sediminicola]|uniref:ribonuclease E inhibitor RraB n=1 Tax=Demequina sediminicola TaxID=1095026 RepID=UPI000782B5A7|nr:ribonuclease E inhibitor RraB [Demequina sediminicola]